MLNLNLKQLFILSIVCLQPTLSQARQLDVVPHADSSTGVKFTIGYTMGTHKGEAKQIAGSAMLTDNDQLKAAKFAVPIASIVTGNKERDCHLREALGINYSNSIFPKKHVCDRSHQLPVSGPNSVQYDKIVFNFTTYNRAPAVPLREGETQTVLVSGTMEIHGVTRAVSNSPVQVQLTKAGGRSSIRLVSSFVVNLSDFGIIVKPFNIVFTSIKVANQAKVNLDLLLVETAR